MMKPLQTHRIIAIRRPGLWWLFSVLLVALILFVVWSAFDYGRHVAGYNKSDSDAQIEKLQTQLEEIQHEIVESRRQATMLERNSHIDSDAAAQLEQVLSQAKSEVSTLTKELSFYKSVVAPEQGSRSLAIQKMRVRANADGGYDYIFMVSQRGRNDQFARGTVDVSIAGVSKDLPLTLKLSEVSNDTNKKVASGLMKFGFKYFQNFEGIITFPENFEPDTLRVKVKPGKGKIKALDESFSWSDLITEGT